MYHGVLVYMDQNATILRFNRFNGYDIKQGFQPIKSFFFFIFTTCRGYLMVIFGGSLDLILRFFTAQNGKTEQCENGAFLGYNIATKITS